MSELLQNQNLENNQSVKTNDFEKLAGNNFFNY